MPNYRFSEISPFEFEELCRDLLQVELGLSLEMFAPGPDEGIDIRYAGPVDGESCTLVAQCKRWAEDDYTGLLSQLKRIELSKIRKLAPKRYILMTSVKLTPHRKEEIIEALHPWIKSSADVYGKQDISGLLARHTEVERRHIKLWLTSTEALDALLNSDIFNRSDDVLERAKRQLRLWVNNASARRASDILKSSHVCIISGAPGIGKTMLAHVLLAGYAHLNYQQIAISGDVSEAERAWRTDIKQVFLFDDFLGRVTYGELRLQTNAESRLAAFLERVRSSDNKRFILTTREYILSEAIQRYERLTEIDLATTKSIVSLEDYTNLIRGQILYNHLFFSELPQNLKTALLSGKKYWDVIRHRNYNPRVIDHAVRLQNVDALSPGEFVSKLFAALENPTALWDSIFKNLSEMARHILRAIASLPTSVLLEDLRYAVQGMAPKDFDPGKFMDSVSTIEGTFIDIKEAKPGTDSPERLVAIRDPSVRDFLWARLETIPGEAAALLEGAVFFEQCEILYEGSNHANLSHRMFLSRGRLGSRVRKVIDWEAVATRALRLIDSSSPILQKVVDVGGSEYFEREQVSLERRTAFLFAMSAAHPTSHEVAISANSMLSATIESWNAGRGSPGDGIQLLNRASRFRDSIREKLLIEARGALLGFISGRLNELEDFEALVSLAKMSPDHFKDPHRGLGSWSRDFEDFLGSQEEWLLEEISDPDSLEVEMSSISEVASAMGIDISQLEEDVENRVQELRNDYEPDEDELSDLFYDDDDENEDEDGNETEIDALFASLRITN